MRILLLGATGRTGSLVLTKALKAGHQVTAIVSEPLKIRGEDIDVVQGTPYHAGIVKTAIRDCDAVVCTLNISRMSDSPWAKLRAPKDLISRSVANTLVAMKENGVKRIVSLSAIGAGDSKKSLPLFVAMFIAFSNIRYAFKDHTRQENLLKHSDTDWTVVRLPILTDKEGETEVLVNKNDDVKLNNTINRASVARFVLTVMENPEYYKTMVGISES